MAKHRLYEQGHDGSSDPAHYIEVDMPESLLPKTLQGRIEVLNMLRNRVDEDGNPAPVITEEQYRELLRAASGDEG